MENDDIPEELREAYAAYDLPELILESEVLGSLPERPFQQEPRTPDELFAEKELKQTFVRELGPLHAYVAWATIIEGRSAQEIATTLSSHEELYGLLERAVPRACEVYGRDVTLHPVFWQRLRTEQHYPTKDIQELRTKATRMLRSTGNIRSPGTGKNCNPEHIFNTGVYRRRRKEFTAQRRAPRTPAQSPAEYINLGDKSMHITELGRETESTTLRELFFAERRALITANMLAPQVTTRLDELIKNTRRRKTEYAFLTYTGVRQHRYEHRVSCLVQGDETSVAIPAHMLRAYAQRILFDFHSHPPQSWTVYLEGKLSIFSDTTDISGADIATLLSRYRTRIGRKQPALDTAARCLRYASNISPIGARVLPHATGTNSVQFYQVARHIPRETLAEIDHTRKTLAREGERMSREDIERRLPSEALLITDPVTYAVGKGYNERQLDRAVTILAQTPLVSTLTQ